MSASQRISVRVSPRSSRDEIIGWDAETRRLKVRIKAAPVNNAANEALIRLISRELKVAKSRIQIVRGANSRDKIVEIDTSESVLSKLEAS